MKPCLNCRILPEKFYGQLDHEKKLFHVVRCPRCSKSVVSYKSINAVKLEWGKLNRVKDPYEQLAELEAENNRLKETIDELHAYIADIHASNRCNCGEKSTGSMTEEICNICGKIITRK